MVPICTNHLTFTHFFGPDSSLDLLIIRGANVTTRARGRFVHVLDVGMQVCQLLPSGICIPMCGGVHVRQLFLDGLSG